MDPDLFKVFVTEFTTAWNREQAAAAGTQAAKAAELDRVRRQIGRLVDALANGTPPAAVNGRPGELEHRRLALAQAVAPGPRLHPNLAEVYRREVAGLSVALASEDAAEARELVRGLVDAIVLVPEDGRLRIEVRGELGAILRLAEGAGNAKRPGAGAEALVQQIKLVAGIGFEPMTFRL